MSKRPVKTKPAGRPDFQVTDVKQLAQEEDFRITVKNNGAGEQKYIDISFSVANFKEGDRMIFNVDYLNVVPETNERNNKFYYD